MTCQFRLVNGLPFQCPWGWNITWLSLYRGILVFKGPIFHFQLPGKLETHDFDDQYPISYKLSGHLVSLKNSRSSSVWQHLSPSSQRHPTRPTEMAGCDGNSHIERRQNSPWYLCEDADVPSSCTEKLEIYGMINMQSTWPHYNLGTVRDEHTKIHKELQGYTAHRI